MIIYEYLRPAMISYEIMIYYADMLSCKNMISYAFLCFYDSLRFLMLFWSQKFIFLLIITKSSIVGVIKASEAGSRLSYVVDIFAKKGSISLWNIQYCLSFVNID